MTFRLLTYNHKSIFFFSSRRRHTRWPRDWSSDVCSSDLHTGDAYADDAALWLAPGADTANVTREIQARVAGGVNLEIAGPGEIREVSLRTFDRTFAVTYALEAVAVAIGLFGLSS